jgi:AraC-like DNA-binding protein
VFIIVNVVQSVKRRHCDSATARRRLRASRAPIKQIAVEARFYDQVHLGRCCKRRFGCEQPSLREQPGWLDGEIARVPYDDRRGLALSRLDEGR